MRERLEMRGMGENAVEGRVGIKGSRKERKIKGVRKDKGKGKEGIGD